MCGTDVQSAHFQGKVKLHSPATVHDCSEQPTCIDGCVWVVINVELRAAICHSTIRLSSARPCEGEDLPWNSLHHLIGSISIEHLLVVGEGRRC